MVTPNRFLLFSCAYGRKLWIFISLHIMFSGEHPAAMQHGDHGGGRQLVAWSWTVMTAFLVMATRWLEAHVHSTLNTGESNLQHDLQFCGSSIGVCD